MVATAVRGFRTVQQVLVLFNKICSFQAVNRIRCFSAVQTGIRVFIAGQQGLEALGQFSRFNKI